ncbi:MAG TPA: flagellar biosynthetic protein FliO [Clostridia bacterium]|nr:flagellar biosynthetic protein FliO [Clostridia bacterium]
MIGTISNVMTVGSTIYGALYFLFMTAVILGAAYYVTKYLARKGLSSANNKNLKIVETIPLGIDKSLLLVKVGEQYLLLGNTQKELTMLTAVDKEKLTLSNASEVYNNMDGESIESYMDKLKTGNESEGMNSIKRNLDKLKSIVRGNKIDV